MEKNEDTKVTEPNLQVMKIKRNEQKNPKITYE